MLCVQRAWPAKLFSIDDDVGLDKLSVQNKFSIDDDVGLDKWIQFCSKPRSWAKSINAFSVDLSKNYLWHYDIGVDWYSLPWLKWLWPKPANKFSKIVPIWILSFKIPLKPFYNLADSHPLEIKILNGEQIKKTRQVHFRYFFLLHDTLTSNEKKYIFVSLSGLW